MRQFAPILRPVIWSYVHVTNHVLHLPLAVIECQCLLGREETWHVQLLCQYWRLLLLIAGGTSWRT